MDAYTCIEAGRLDYITKHQDSLRFEYVSGLYDALSKGDMEARSVGSKFFFQPLLQQALGTCIVTIRMHWPYVGFMVTHNIS